MNTYIDSLLQLYLGQPNGKRVALEIRESNLIAQIKTGYDIVLISEIFFEISKFKNAAHQV